MPNFNHKNPNPKRNTNPKYNPNHNPYPNPNPNPNLPLRPFAAIVGGSKVSSKISVIEAMLSKVRFRVSVIG
jgi:hypothetical protein